MSIEFTMAQKILYPLIVDCAYPAKLFQAQEGEHYKYTGICGIVALTIPLENKNTTGIWLTDNENVLFCSMVPSVDALNIKIHEELFCFDARNGFCYAIQFVSRKDQQKFTVCYDMISHFDTIKFQKTNQQKQALMSYVNRPARISGFNFKRTFQVKIDLERQQIEQNCFELTRRQTGKLQKMLFKLNIAFNNEESGSSQLQKLIFNTQFEQLYFRHLQVETIKPVLMYKDAPPIPTYATIIEKKKQNPLPTAKYVQKSLNKSKSANYVDLQSKSNKSVISLQQTKQMSVVLTDLTKTKRIQGLKEVEKDEKEFDLF